MEFYSLRLTAALTGQNLKRLDKQIAVLLEQYEICQVFSGKERTGRRAMASPSISIRIEDSGACSQWLVHAPESRQESAPSLRKRQDTC